MQKRTLTMAEAAVIGLNVMGWKEIHWSRRSTARVFTREDKWQRLFVSFAGSIRTGRTGPTAVLCPASFVKEVRDVGVETYKKAQKDRKLSAAIEVWLKPPEPGVPIHRSDEIMKSRIQRWLRGEDDGE